MLNGGDRASINLPAMLAPKVPVRSCAAGSSGYRSVPVGTIRMGKKGRPRPEGYRMEIEPREAAVVLGIFKAYADGLSLTRIVCMLNEEQVPGRMRAAKGWSPATVSRLLDNEKYVGRWVWNKTESRRDPRTGRRRRFTKPESDWVVQEDDSLHLVPEALWEQVRAGRQEVRRSWSGGKGRRGFSREQGGREQHFPTHLLSGSMVCQRCGAAIAQVSGKAGGYYGCLGAAKGACDNKMLIRRKLAEAIILKAVREQLDQAEHIQYMLGRVEAEVVKLYAHIPETVRSKEAELGAAASCPAREDRVGADEGRDRPALLPGPDLARHPVAARTAPGPGGPGSRFEFFAMVEAAGIEPETKHRKSPKSKKSGP